VHGAHDGPVGHGHARHFKRLQQMGVLRMSGRSSGHAPKFGQSPLNHQSSPLAEQR